MDPRVNEALTEIIILPFTDAVERVFYLLLQTQERKERHNDTKPLTFYFVSGPYIARKWKQLNAYFVTIPSLMVEQN